MQQNCKIVDKNQELKLLENSKTQKLELRQNLKI